MRFVWEKQYRLDIVYIFFISLKVTSKYYTGYVIEKKSIYGM